MDFVGDFNMIECPKDKVGGGKFDWKNNENRFKRTFGINDPKMGLKGGHEGIWYTWCNNQANKARIYCHKTMQTFSLSYRERSWD